MSNNDDTSIDKDDTTDDSTDIESNDATSSDKDEKSKGLQIPKHRFDAEVAKRKAAESQLNTVADSMLEGVPEQFKALIPEGMNAQQKIDWYSKASSSGVFTQKVDVPKTDDANPSVTPKKEDYSNMSAAQKIAAGYK